MRRPLLPLAALALTGCFDPDAISGLPPLFSCEAPLFPTEACVDASHPVDFYERVEGIVLGSEVEVEVLILEGTAVTFSVDRPDLLELVRVDDGGPVVRGVAEGWAVLSASANGRTIDTRSLRVSPIASVDFYFDGGPDRVPLTELAALPGAIERVRLVPRASDLTVLSGAETLTTLVTDGAVSTAAVDDGELRGRDLDLFGATPPPGFHAGFRADALGTGALVAEVDGVPIAALPITVVPAATTVALTVASPTTAAGWFQLAGLSGTDDRGVPVAGLVGDFTVAPSTLASIDDPRAGEAFIRALAAGEVTVTATLPDRTLTTTFTIVP